VAICGIWTLQRVPRRATDANSTPGTIGLITLGVKSAGKPGAGKRHAGFAVAGAGNVIMGAGLRASAKALEVPPDPTVGAPVPDPTCEEPGTNRPMAEIMWHRRETRRQTENTNVSLLDGKDPAYTPIYLLGKFDPCKGPGVNTHRTGQTMRLKVLRTPKRSSCNHGRARGPDGCPIPRIDVQRPWREVCTW
jgi:hypothetical protein